MKKITILFLLFSLISGISNAQWSSDASVNNAICTLAGEQAIPKIATCPNGDTYIGYFSNESGNYDIRLQRLDSQGNELWASGGILISNNSSMTWLTDWDMAADINNHCILTWQDVRNGNNNTYAYRISPTGSFIWGANGIALSNNAAFNASPKVVCTQAGNAVFAWSSDDVIIMQKINPAGAKQWGDDGITLSSANRLTWPQLMPVGTDDVIMKYFDDSGLPNAPTRHVYAQRYGPTGSPVWTNPTVVSNAGGISAWTQIFPFINDGSDGFYIAWHDDRDNNNLASSWVQHVNSAGVVQYAANGVEVSTTAGFNHYYPYLASPPGSSEVYVYWNEMNSLQSQKGIFGQKVSATGTRMWGNGGMVFIPVTATNVLPLGAGSSNTDMIVLFEQSTDAVNGTLKAMCIGTDGSFVWPGNYANISTVSSSKVHTVINEFQNNQWIISWEDNRSGTADIYAQNLIADGTIGVWDPQYGSIQGQITLNGGTGNITQVVVTAGSESTFPDPSGYYVLNVLVGTYTVTASLNGYSTGTYDNVVVLENQATTDVDIILEPIPTTGYITGQVTLTSGSGDVTQTLITAGTHTTSPNASGFYTLETEVGLWDVEANLAGYTPQIRSSVNVTPGGTTPNINFSLSPLPTTGYIQGTVSLTGGTADVTQATVFAGSASAQPGANGFYFIEVDAGTYTVTATHPMTDTQVLNGVVVDAGLATSDVNFTLNVNRTNLVCKAVDQYGFAVYGAEISVVGPEETYTGTIDGDSLVFSNVLYGMYEGTGTIFGSMPVYSDTLINGVNHHLMFEFFLDNTQNLSNDQSLTVQPNPASSDSRIVFISNKPGIFNLSLIDSYGSVLSGFSAGFLDKGTHEWPVSMLTGNAQLSSGVYIVKLENQQSKLQTRFILVK